MRWQWSLRTPPRRKIPYQLRGFGCRPTRDIACQAPSSNTARPAASSIALQPITTSVGLTALLRPNGRGAALALEGNGEEPEPPAPPPDPRLLAFRCTMTWDEWVEEWRAHQE